MGTSVGYLLGPRFEAVVELVQGLDAGVLGLGDEPFPYVAVQPLLLAPPFGLSGQSRASLWITEGLDG